MASAAPTGGVEGGKIDGPKFDGPKFDGPTFDDHGPYALSDEAVVIDRALFAMDMKVDWLTRLTPNNIDDARDAFFTSGYRRMPALTYDPLDFDPDTVRDRVNALPVQDIDDPLIEMLLMDKQREIGLQCALVTHRSDEGGPAAALALFGGVGNRMLARAHHILDEVPDDIEAEPDYDAHAIARVGERECAHYRSQVDDFTFRVIVDDEPGGSLVTHEGNLHIAPDYMVARARVVPLIAHELGTHTITRYNGRKQPLHVLRCGLPDYDALQEGIAVLSEYLTGYMPPVRLRTLAARVVAADMAVRGEGMSRIFAWLMDDCRFDEMRAYDTAMRALRGGAMTKDALYLKGLVELVAHLRHGGRFEELFFGKFALRQLPILEKLIARGLIKRAVLLPRYLSEPGVQERLERVRNTPVAGLYQVEPETSETPPTLSHPQRQSA